MAGGWQADEIQNETGGISSCNGLFPMIKKEGCLLLNLVTLHRHLNLGIVGYGKKEGIF